MLILKFNDIPPLLMNETILHIFFKRLINIIIQYQDLVGTNPAVGVVTYLIMNVVLMMIMLLLEEMDLILNLGIRSD